MKLFWLVSCWILASCATWHSPFGQKTIKNSKASYTLQDISGKYRVNRELLYKNDNTKFLSRFIIKDKLTNQDLEKTLAYSKVGKQKVLPVLSQHTSWLEKEKFFSQIKLLKNRKSYEVTLVSPEKKWSGKRTVEVPIGEYTCFFSQVPDCLVQNGIMSKFKKDPDIEIDIIVIWDNYPFYAEQYVGLREELYSPASLRIDGLQGNSLRIALEVQSQILFYTYNENLEYLNTYWVAQGYRLEKNVIKETKR